MVVNVNPGSNPGFMDNLGTVVDPATFLPPASDFGYERSVSKGRFGTDGQYYFMTHEGDEKTYWALDPDTEELAEGSRGETRKMVGGDTGLTRDSGTGEEDSWSVPDRSNTSCTRALDVRSGACLFGTTTGRSEEGRLEIWTLGDDTNVSFLPGSEEEATSVEKIVPPNDKSYSSAAFSPDGSQVVFMAITEETMSDKVGDLYVVDVENGERRPKKLNGGSPFTVGGLEETWVILGWR